FDTLRALHAEGRTIVYTTHIMQDVEALCTHVGIVDGGRLLLSDSLEAALSGRCERAQLIVEVGRDVDVEQVRAALGAADIEADVQPRVGSLEQVFLDLTGHALRDD